MKFSLKRVLLLFMIFSNISFSGSFFCIPLPCDHVITYAMTKQRDSISDRLDDLKDTIDANTKQTKKHTLIVEQEILAYIRLSKRVYKETFMLQEAVKISNDIKNSSVNQAIISIIFKEKK